MFLGFFAILLGFLCGVSFCMVLYETVLFLSFNGIQIDHNKEKRSIHSFTQES